MKENSYLPIGSVVLLKGATKKVVIIGYGVVEKGKTTIWDYLGCAYPIGVISSEKNLIFNKEQVAKIIQVGYTDEEGEKFRKNLKIGMDQYKKSNK